MTLWHIVLISFILLWSALIHIFYSFLEARNNRQNANRCSPYSKDFKIDDPVVVFLGSINVTVYTYINSVLIGSSGLTFSIDAIDSKSFPLDVLRHPTKEELEKYFRK